MALNECVVRGYTKGTYTGRHREFDMNEGIGRFHLGDRNREKMINCADAVEERENNDPNARRV